MLHRGSEGVVSHRPATGNLLVGKLEPPEPGVAVIARPRLYEQLDVATAHRVTVLDAPAGSGKTVLLASWLRNRPAQAAAWLSLDQDDNRPAVFWAYVQAALATVCPSLTGLTMPTAFDAFVSELARRIAGTGRPVLLVLDEVHVLHDPEVLAGLDTLLRIAPASLRVVLSGRGQAALALARLRIAGHVADLGFAELAGTTEEAAELLAAWGVELRPEEIDAVMTQTEGWMGGFRLAALWLAAQGNNSRDIASFSGADPVVADYLRDEILRPAVRRFLLRTCLFEPLNGSLADSLTAEHGGSLMLEELVRDNALVAVVGPHRTWFRYRPLLRQFLRAELHRRLPDEVDGLRLRAAHWYAEQRLTTEAVRAAIDGKDWDFAANLLSDAGRNVLTAGRAVIEPVLHRLPPQRVEADQGLAAALADLRLTESDPDGAEPYLRLAERQPPDGADNESSEGLRHRIRCSELRLLQGSLRGVIDTDQIRAATDLLEAADGSVLYGSRLPALAYRIGLSLVWSGRLVEGRRSIERSLHHPDAEPALRRRAMEWCALLLAGEGRLTSAEDMLGQLGPVAEASQAEPTSVLARLASSRLNLERERLNEAWQLLDEPPLSDLCSPAGELGEPTLNTVPVVQRAEVLLGRGGFAAAQHELAAIGLLGAEARPCERYHAGLVGAEVLLAEGNLERARETLTAAVDDWPEADPAAHAPLSGRLLLAEGRLAAALDVVRPQLEHQTPNARLLDAVGAHLVAAAAQRRLGSQPAAEEHLQRALALAEPHRAVRTFIRSGRIVRSLLTVAIPQDGPYGSMRALLLHHFDAQSTPWEAELRPIRLTASESAILSFLPGHPTNEEIAADLFVSVNTVKTHLRSLYRKLDVASRREAVSRARQRGLLPE